jgi:hypothetical protein
MGNELWFFYSGRSTLHNQLPNDGAMGLGILRIDGFASVGGPGQVGTLTTRPLVLKGRSLFVNADAESGSLTVEVLRDVPGTYAAAVATFDRNNCIPLTADTVRHEVRWQASADLKALDQKPVRLRFHLTNGRLYSFWTE